jgi:uncharacterized protein (DUF362 family)
MQMTAPIMSGFVLYLLSLAGVMGGAFQAARKGILQSRYLRGALLTCIVILLLFLAVDGHSKGAAAPGKAPWIIQPNQPLGAGRGIFPGRVVWAHDPAATAWDGATGNWWDDNVVSQAAVDLMMKECLLKLTGATTEREAWAGLFRHFNAVHGQGERDYRKGETVAIKINANNTASHQDSPEINATPQLVLALLKSMIREAGLPQANLTVFDASRLITNNIFDRCHAAFPDVVFVDNVGGDGRVKAAYRANAIPYSVDNGKLATGLATCAVDATYLINMALLKGHVGQGVTLCAKNYYGVTSIDKDWRNNAHNGFNPNRDGKAQYMTFVDFLAHQDLGAKTLLFLIDGIYGSRLVNGPPGPKWKMEPFNNNWACTLLASQDPVAIDAVGLDFLRTEWPDAPDMSFSDQYLIEAALADNPPSKTKYDPQRNDMSVSSLGVMEHWNNAKEKKYSRNLGRKEGIELVPVSLPAQ